MERRSFLRQGAVFAVATMAGGKFLIGCASQETTPAAQDASPTTGDPVATANTAMPTSSPAPAATDLRNMVYVTPFQHIIAHADVYVGMQEGYFAEEGLFITPIGGTGTASSVSQVAAGQGTFGKAASIITCPLIADDGVEIITVAQKDQRSQYSVASDPENPLTHPRDWQGKAIGVISVGGTTELLLDAMSVAAGLDPGNVEKRVTGADVGSLEFLRRGEVAGFMTFIGSETAFDQMGEELHYLNTDEFAPVPGDSYIVKQEDTEKEAEAIVGFLRACRRGWEFMEQPDNHDAVMSAIAELNPIEVQDRELAIAKIEAEVELSRPADGEYLDVDLEAWEAGLDIMYQAGIIENQNLGLEDFVTTEFLEQL